MIRLAADGIPEDECPICGDEMEDRRHVAVECFYDVREVVPGAEKVQVLVEVPEEGSFWGITRRYREGSRDRPVVNSGGMHGKVPVTTITMEQDPLPPVRLLEKPQFSVACCKTCRAEFLNMFGMWSRGELVNREQHPEANIPIREYGTLRFITKEEWIARQRKRKLAADNPKDPTDAA